MAFSLQGFHKQRMPFVLRLLRCVLPFPCSQVMEIVGQHLVAPVFFLPVSLFRGWRSYLGSDRRLFPCVIGNREIVRQLHSGFLAGQSKQAGNKINCISVRLASETMETLVHLHARIFVIVKRADCHAVTVDRNAVQLCRLSGGDIAFYCFKYIHRIFLSGNKKKDTSHFHNENGKCLKAPYSVFCAVWVCAPAAASPVPNRASISRLRSASVRASSQPPAPAQGLCRPNSEYLSSASIPL